MKRTMQENDDARTLWKLQQQKQSAQYIVRLTERLISNETDVDEIDLLTEIKNTTKEYRSRLNKRKKL